MSLSGNGCDLDISQAAYSDPLTGLPNWVFLRACLEKKISQAAGSGQPLALVSVSLSRFREINNILGPRVGDQVLLRVAQRLRSGLPDEVVVARQSGDEFGLVFPDADLAQAQDWTRRIYGWLLRPFSLNVGLPGDDVSATEISLDIDMSFGIAMYPAHSGDVDSLMRQAGVAVQLAKHRHDRVVVYDPELDRRDADRLLLAGQLRRAIAEDALSVHYQPIIDMKKRRLEGVESLVRWDHPERGRVPNDQIVPLAEQTGLIRLLDYWVMDQALQQCMHWQSSGLSLVVSVNLSAKTLDDSHLIQTVSDNLVHMGIADRLLQLEITESALMAQPEQALERLQALAARGVLLALDDYGTGYSSLAYLKRLPLSKLKIDQSFVADMKVDENDAVIVRSTIELAHNLGLQVVAEGVADNETWRMLAALGNDYVQGNFIGPAMPGEELAAWLAASPWSA